VYRRALIATLVFRKHSCRALADLGLKPNTGT